MIYTVCGKNKNGEVVNIFTDGRTYKRKSQAERWMAEMQEITESELFIVAKEDAARVDPNPEAEALGFQRAVEMLRNELVYLDKWDGASVADWLEKRERERVKG